MNTAVQSSIPNRIGLEKVEESRNPWIFAIAVCAIVSAAIVSWFVFDNRVPTTDEAGHILNALDYKNLLGHPKLFRGTWWHDFLSVNRFYPPFVYIFNGALKAIFGNGRCIDVLSVVVFSCVLNLSVFGITRTLTKANFPAVVAAVVVNLYPLISNLSHDFLLDFPLTAMISAGLFALVWWHEERSWKRTAVAGAALALACMTKQIAAAYLFFPGLWCLVSAIDTFKRRKNPTEILQVIVIGASVIALALPWVLTNYQWIRGYSAETAASMASAGVHLLPPATFADYICGLWHSMSPLLSAGLILAFIGLQKRDHFKLLPVYLSGFGGLVLISSLTWTYPLDRYASGALIATAIVTGFGAYAWMVRAKSFAVGATFLILGVAVLQLLSFFYVPFPLAWLPISDLSHAMDVNLREFRGLVIRKANPYPDGLSWGQQWVLSSVREKDGQAPVFINILPSDGIFNPHSFELLAREQGLKLRPTTSRTWTIVGDRVDFSPETALYYQWYVLKTGGQGNQLKDAASAENYKQLTEFVETSGKFNLIGKRPMPDGSVLSLYRQR